MKTTESPVEIPARILVEAVNTAAQIHEPVSIFVGNDGAVGYAASAGVALLFHPALGRVIAEVDGDGNATAREAVRFEAADQPGVFVYAEQEADGVGAWIVTSVVPGFPATEAFDDWFANESDAVEIAAKLALGIAID